MPLFGIDGASFQGDLNWAVLDAVTAFGWEKVTQGTGYTNPFWPRARAFMSARAQFTGFVGGGYMFLEAGDGAAQADHFAAQAGSLDGLGLAIDIEPAGSRPTLADGRAAVARLRHHYPHHPVVGYIPHWYWG
jgi:hypothetical protein